MPTKETSKHFAKKSFGQNFLVNQNVIGAIIDSLDLHAADTVVEIGPGRGALTEKLLENAGRVIAIELDRDLIPGLEASFRGYKNLELLSHDALKIDFSSETFASANKLKLAANLPYYISTAILQRLIEQRSAFSTMVLMFQREVVDRITAEAGSSERGFLTVLVEAYLEVEKLFDVPPSAFQPMPKVWSSVARFTPKPDVDLDAAAFRSIVSSGFAQKRKTILNNLRQKSADAKSVLEAAGIDPMRRAETLKLAEWTALTDSLKPAKPE
jgi:16S rRNA (adenine1518-N6/adenine1519-N6)-dimethyltransferase